MCEFKCTNCVREVDVDEIYARMVILFVAINTSDDVCVCCGALNVWNSKKKNKNQDLLFIQKSK